MHLELAAAGGPVPLAAITVAEAPPATRAFQLRGGRASDAAEIHALVEAHLDEGHLLPRTKREIEAHAARFVVATDGARVVACGELAPLSVAVAEVRSLVVAREARSEGVGRQLVDDLVRRARLQGFHTLSAFTHGPGYFIRLGFSLVPHHWMGEKIVADCQSCALFRRCGQSAVVLSLTDAGRGGRLVRA